MINPNRITKDNLPLIVVSTDSSGFIAMWIRWRTKSYYSHGMGMIWPGEFASQGNVFSSVPLDRYMTEQNRLKFFGFKNLSHENKTLIMKRVINRLNKKRKWWNYLSDYDYLGIFGQAIGIPKINNPLKTFCIEEVKEDYLDGIIDLEYEKDNVVYKLPKHANPKQFNEFLKNHPEIFLFGRWSAD